MQYKSYKDIPELQKRAIVSLFQKGFTHIELKELLGHSRHLIEKVIQKHMIEITPLYQREIESIYPLFQQCMNALDTNVIEMRCDNNSKILSRKRAAIYHVMTKGKDARFKILVCSMFSREGHMYHAFDKAVNQKDVKDNIEKIERYKLK